MQILGLSIATPDNQYSTEELMDSFPCQLPEGVKKNVFAMGVSKRHLINHGTHSKPETILSEIPVLNLCTQASEKAIEKACLSAKDIGFFIMAYDVSPFLCPGLSQLAVRRLGFSPYIEHVNAQGLACSAFPKSLKLAEHFLAVKPDKYVLICISGVNSYWFQNQVQGLSEIMEIRKINSIKNMVERLAEMRKWIAAIEFFLFGDGVASIVAGKGDNELYVAKIVEVTNLGKKDYLAGYARLAALNQPFSFGLHSHLDKTIPELGLKYVSVALKKLLGKNSEHNGNVSKKWAIHTGSEKIIDLIAKQHHIPREKINESYEVLRDFGNLAGASLPFILEKITSKNKLANGDGILTLGYGWGFSASAGLLEFRE